MAKFPVYQRQVGLQGGSTASYASDGAFTAPARALQVLGGAIQGVGDDFARIEAKFREDKRNSQLSLDTSDMQLQLEEQDRQARQSATGEAAGFADSARERFDSFVKMKLEANPDQEYQRRFQDWANDYKVRYVTKAATFQAESEIGKRTTDLGAALENFGKLTYADPSQYDSALKQGYAALDAAKSWMTPEQEALAREKFTHDINYARAKGKVDTDPDGFLADAGVTRGRGDNPLIRLIDRTEGGGRYDTLFGHAQKQGGAFAGIDVSKKTIGELKQFASSDGAYGSHQKSKLGYLATPMGRFQIVGSTLAAAAKEMGLSDSTVFSPEVQNAMFNHLVDKRISGPRTMEGKVASLRQEWEGFKNVPDAQLAQAITAYENGDRGALTGGLSNPNVADNPAYAGLSVDEIRSLATQADQAVNAARTAAYNAAKDSMELGIATGQVISENQILGSDLGDGDKATLLGKFRARNEDEALISSTLQGLADRSLNVSPYDSKATKAIDTISERTEKNGTAEQFVQSSEEIVRQTGIVPKPYLNRLRQGLESTKVEEVGTAAELARRLYQSDPAALGRREGGDGVEKDAIAYSHFVDNVGLSPEQAAQRLMDMKDPEKVKARASLMESKPVKDFVVKQATENKVRDIFDPGMFGFDPQLGSNPAQSAAMVGEYKSILEESLWDAAGDQDLAKTFAAQRFSQRYGTSAFTLSGENIVERLPPEKTYPVGADGTHEYIRDQVIFALEQEGIQTDKVYLQSSDITNDDFVRGQPARYIVYYEKDGEIEQFNLPFFGVPEAESGIPSKRIEESRARRDRNLQQSPMEQMLREDAIRGAEVPSPLIGQP